MGQIFLGLLPLGLLLLAACIPAWCAAPGELDILEDFVRRFPDAEVDNATEAAAGRRESSGGVVLPGIYLHPNNTGDASVLFKDTSITLSSRRRDARLFLLFRWGLRDGVPWGDETKRPNGVRFAVDLNDAEAMVEDVTGDGWRARALELTEAA
ncbi:MAG: hypothetical protein HYV26_18570, partial [Candidatus Hydrogenedentes bacterium]|nr:hypothetical protein [Candidatus Hydrogenedentota bacterium]